MSLTPGENGVRADPNGFPIHGVLAAYPGWRVAARSDNELTAELDFGADPHLLACFPFPHVLTVAVRLAERTLTDSHLGHRDRRHGGPAVFRLPPLPAAPRGTPQRVGHRDARRCAT